MRVFVDSPLPGSPGGPDVWRIKAGPAATVVTHANAGQHKGSHYVSFPAPHRPLLWRRQTPLPAPGRLRRMPTASTSALTAKVVAARDKAEAGLLRMALRWAMRCLWR